MALSCASWRRPQPAVSWREAFGVSTSGPRANDVYNAGGWLAGYLLATRGARAFVDLYRDARDGQSAAEFAATFARVYGESLDDVWTEMIAAGRPPAFCPWECSRPQAPLDGVTPVAERRRLRLRADARDHARAAGRAGRHADRRLQLLAGDLRRRLGSARGLLRRRSRAPSARRLRAGRGRLLHHRPATAATLTLARAPAGHVRQVGLRGARRPRRRGWIRPATSPSWCRAEPGTPISPGRRPRTSCSGHRRRLPRHRSAPPVTPPPTRAPCRQSTPLPVQGMRTLRVDADPVAGRSRSWSPLRSPSL